MQQPRSKDTDTGDGSPPVLILLDMKIAIKVIAALAGLAVVFAVVHHWGTMGAVALSVVWAFILTREDAEK